MYMTRGVVLCEEIRPPKKCIEAVPIDRRKPRPVRLDLMAGEATSNQLLALPAWRWGSRIWPAVWMLAISSLLDVSGKSPSELALEVGL